MRYRWFDMCYLVLIGCLSISTVTQASSMGRGNPSGNDGPEASTPHEWTTMCTTQCYGNVSAKDLKKNYRVEYLKEDILRKLRMQMPPNVTGRIPEVPAMQTLLNQMHSDSVMMNTDPAEVDLITPTTFLLLSQTVPTDLRSPFRDRACYFRFSRELRSNQVVTAQLGIYLHAGTRNNITLSPRNGTSQYTYILVYQISRSNRRFEKTLTRRRKLLLSTTELNKWYFFDVKRLVEHWIRNPDQNYGIQILAADHDGNTLAVLPTSDIWAGGESNSKRPYIEIQIQNQAPARPRRSMDLDCVEASSERRCCRYPLTIDFDLFRWDWVIAPKRYEAYYCSGECPLLFMTRDPVTHLISQHPTGNHGVPCCAPTHLSPLQMLYIDNSMNIVFGTLPGMVVERCGCS